MSTFVKESAAGTSRQPARPPAAFDAAKYEAMLDESDLSEAQKREFLETLWQIMVQFVDLGFGVHPLQSIPSDGQRRAISLDALLAGMVNSGLSKTENDAASRPHRAKGGKEES